MALAAQAFQGQLAAPLVGAGQVAATGASGPHHGVLAPHRLHQVGVLGVLGPFGGLGVLGLLAVCVAAVYLAGPREQMNLYSGGRSGW